MEKRFIYFSTKAKFLSATQGTEYLFTSIVFIGDTKEIWNRGIFYGTPNDFDINDYLTKSDAASTYQPKGDYLTQHQDLSEYAKTAELESALEDLKAELEAEIEDVDVTDQLKDYAKSADVTKEIADAVKGVEAKIPSLDGYATQEWVEEQEYLTEVPAEYAKTVDVETMVANVKSEILGGAGEDYDTLKEIEEWVEEHQDLYDALVAANATKDYVDGKVDGLASEDYVDSAVEDMATTDYVDGKIAEIEIPSVDGLASEEYVDEAVEDMATMTWVKGQNYLTTHQSLDDYAKSADVTSEIADAVDGLSETYYSKEEVDAMFAWGEY